jgi:hypothetical protein
MRIGASAFGAFSAINANVHDPCLPRPVSKFVKRNFDILTSNGVTDQSRQRVVGHIWQLVMAGHLDWEKRNQKLG